MDIIKAYAKKNLCYITGHKMYPQGIVVHSTGANNPNLNRYVDCPEEVGINTYNNHWNTATPGGRKVCVHAFIGYDKNKNIRVAEILPLDICCWGVGTGNKGSYNNKPPYIQFEICEDSLTDKVYYQKAFDVAVQYCARLCGIYGFTIEQIVSHREAHKKGYGSNHGDPEHWMKNFGETMDDFRLKVSKHLNSNNNSETIEAVTNTNTDISDGDLVSLSSNAVYYNGTAIPKWVKDQNWYVDGTPIGDRVIINENQAGTNTICSPVHSKYLMVINTPTNIIKLENKYPYKVKVTASSLNIRHNAGTNSNIVGCITDKGVYTIIDEKNAPGASSWGKLKSGIGWISLDFAKKL